MQKGMCGPGLGNNLTSGGGEDCASATPISGSGPYLGDNVGATQDGATPSCPLAGLYGTDVWYVWTAPITATATVTLCNPGTNFDTVLAVYDGGCGSSELACDDDACFPPATSKASFAVVQGQNYTIRIGGWAGATGTYELRVDLSDINQFCISGGDLPAGSCPCSNEPSGGGLGCNNFSACSCDPKSGTLDVHGFPIVGPEDTLELLVTGMNNTSTTIFFSGTSQVSHVISGGGLRCVGGQLKRIFSASSPAVSGGAISSLDANPMGVSVSDRSAALNSTISPGQTRYYYNAYRDPMAAAACGFPTSTINTTNAVSVVWL